MHHASSGNLDRRGHGDVTLLTVAEYSGLTPLKRLGYRLYRSPFIMVLLGAPINFIVLQRFSVGQSFHKPNARRSISAFNIALAVVFGVPMLLLGPVLVLATYLPVMVVASWIGNWLFYVQHQFENTYWERAGNWDFHAAALAGGSFFKLPRILQWFSGNIGLHHVHHLCSTIPNYHLQACLDANVDLTKFTRTISLRESFGCWKFALWDEFNSQLVTFVAAAKCRGAIVEGGLHNRHLTSRPDGCHSQELRQTCCDNSAYTVEVRTALNRRDLGRLPASGHGDVRLRSETDRYFEDLLCRIDEAERRAIRRGVVS